MNSTIIEIESENALGETRTFVMRQHPTREGLAVIDKLLAAGLGPIVEVLFSSADLPKDFDKLPEEEQTRLLAKIANTLDKKQIVQSLTDGLSKGGGLVSLAPDLLAYTSLDGENLRGSMFDVTFQGNYGEALYLCRKAIEHNGFFALLSTFSTD